MNQWILNTGKSEGFFVGDTKTIIWGKATWIQNLGIKILSWNILPNRLESCRWNSTGNLDSCYELLKIMISGFVWDFSEMYLVGLKF